MKTDNPFFKYLLHPKSGERIRAYRRAYISQDIWRRVNPKHLKTIKAYIKFMGLKQSRYLFITGSKRSEYYATTTFWINETLSDKGLCGE